MIVSSLLSAAQRCAATNGKQGDMMNTTNKNLKNSNLAAKALFFRLIAEDQRAVTLIMQGRGDMISNAKVREIRDQFNAVDMNGEVAEFCSMNLAANAR